MTDTNETEMTDRDLLVMIAAIALKNDGVNISVIETLETLGRTDIIEEARIVNETDDDVNEESDLESEDELDESSDE